LALADQLRGLALQLMAMADHLVQVNRLGARGNRGEEPAGLDLAELGRIADQDQLGLRPLGVVNQPRHRPRVDHPGLVDHQDRALGKRLPTRGACLQPLGAQHVRRPPGRRRDPQLGGASCPSLGRGDESVGLAGAGLADDDHQASPPPRSRRTIASWSNFIEGRLAKPERLARRGV
jgi:hypothetical protein